MPKSCNSALLPQSERLYATLVNSIGGIVWEADGLTFRFSFVSPQAERILGYPAQQWLDEPDFWRNHMHPDDVEHSIQFCADATARGIDHEFEYRMFAADGRVVWLHDIVTFQREPSGGVRLSGIMLDITERRRAEEELRANQQRLALAEEELRQAQKMEAVGRLAGGVAHDFNNLLTVIIGYTELLRDALGPDNPRTPVVSEIAGAAARAAELTGQLLAFGRKQILAPRILDLNALISDAEKMLRRLLGEDVTLVTLLRPELTTVRADPVQLQQVLLNLAVNARDAMPEGGTLTVETAEVVVDGVAAGWRPDLPSGAYVRLSVSDTGCGMLPEVRARVFEPFFTTKGLGKGTGLGLSTVYGIVKQTGGDIEVESEPGRGATFRVYLPRAAEGEPSLAPPSAGAERDLRGVETVLLVEDEAVVRAVARLALEREGYTVLEAADADGAGRVWDQDGAGVDLLVTDVVLPGKCGRELAGRLAAQRPGLRVLYLSGHTEDAMLLRGVVAEDVDFLPKPFRPEDLTTKVRDVLDRR